MEEHNTMKTIEEILQGIAENNLSVWTKHSEEFGFGVVHVWVPTELLVGAGNMIERVFGDGSYNKKHGNFATTHVVHPRHIPEGFEDALKAFNEVNPNDNRGELTAQKIQEVYKMITGHTSQVWNQRFSEVYANMSRDILVEGDPLLHDPAPQSEPTPSA